MTYCLEGSCSIQLSYRTNVLRGGKIKEKTGYRQKEKSRRSGTFFNYAFTGFLAVEVVVELSLVFLQSLLLSHLPPLHFDAHSFLSHFLLQSLSCALNVAADNETASINNNILFMF
jgi:hypothetical protein